MGTRTRAERISASRPKGPGLRPGTPTYTLDFAPGKPGCPLCRGAGTNGKANKIRGTMRHCSCISEEAKLAQQARVEAHNDLQKKLQAARVGRTDTKAPLLAREPTKEDITATIERLYDNKKTSIELINEVMAYFGGVANAAEVAASVYEKLAASVAPAAAGAPAKPAESQPAP